MKVHNPLDRGGKIFSFIHVRVRETYTIMVCSMIERVVLLERPRTWKISFANDVEGAARVKPARHEAR